MGLVLRLGGGEPTFNLAQFIPYGDYVPYKTVAMLASLITLALVSFLFKYLFQRKLLSEKFDIFDCQLSTGGRSFENFEFKATTSNKYAAENIAYKETQE